MRALVFGAPPDPADTRPEPANDVEAHLLRQPFGLHQVPEPTLLRSDWVLLAPRLSGVCGSDAKLVLGDFSDGDLDNPMAAFSSLPHVPGHEVVADVVQVGRTATGVEVGQRVVLDPWLGCVPRGIDPPCPACQAGDLSLCHHFTDGDLGPGVHVGVTTKAPGGWADRLAAHCTMVHPVPDQLPDDIAVLADPCAVSLHAVVRHPPPPDGRVLVYGAGTLGVTTVALLRALHPDVAVAVVARFPAQAAAVERLGADLVVAHEPDVAVVEAVADWSGGVLHPVLSGLPMAHPGGVDVVYDTVARPQTLAVGVRVLRARGTLVQTGVHTPGRWESTPVYFKELTLAGSNAFGVEVVHGVRRHAIDHSLALAASGQIDLRGVVTHRFALEAWWPALQALADPGRSGAIKVVFAPGDPAGGADGQPDSSTNRR
jgi:threonine dehydrogenase-like Zn-dependent dehydrogenase